MFLFRKKQNPIVGRFCGLIDCHSHVLPGVDDGVRTMEEALEVLKRYEELGVVKLWLTPHIMEDMPNETALLRERFEELKGAYHGNIVLALASENMIDGLFEQRLEKGDLLPFGEMGDHLLVETSYFSAPMGMEQIFAKIKSKGYHPILAHPERYLYLEKSDYQRLREMGVKFQLNLFSLCGLYGKRAHDMAKWLQKREYYTFAGSDLHSLEQLSAVLS